MVLYGGDYAFRQVSGIKRIVGLKTGPDTKKMRIRSWMRIKVRILFQIKLIVPVSVIR